MRFAVTRGNRTVLVMAAVAVLSLVAGLLLSRLITSPAQAAADAAAPVAGPVTVPVESRVLANDVTLRGDAQYDDPADVRIETGEIGGSAVVTGQVPDVGATLDAAGIALEIIGRPVIVLPGTLPTYRTLREGVSGPDVRQLKAALATLGIAAGKQDSDVYDAATAAGVVALYQRVGYQPPATTKDLKEAVKAAQDSVRAAEQNLATAQLALTQAKAGPSDVDRLQADNAVRAAERALAAAQNPPTGTETEAPAAPTDVAELQDALALAVAQRAALLAGTGAAAEAAQVSAAQLALTDARTALTEAKASTLTPLPASEVVFLPSLPRRVDDVTVKQGSVVNGPVMSVSGATLEIVASAARKDADLLTVGAVGATTVDGTDIPLTVTAIEAPGTSGEPSDDSTGGTTSSSGTTGSDSGRYTVRFAPGELTEAQVTALQGTNVRVKVPVSSTGGEVLAVPLAALTAGPGGESRVERQAKDGTSELVTVETGLAAGGYVQITTSSTPLAAGDLVVVGISGPTAEPATTDDATTAGADG
ncbi:hypothetical protein ACGIF2_17000 [Cellulomonas sp. P22]|uniref:hypothetical protein n=1 Tax=Cellulomonas sp. P22 TaxID=3373189 RepID=UPI00379FD238